MTMDTENNLHASIPPSLLTEAQKAASTDRITMDEFVTDAVERRLRDRRRQLLYAYGEGQAEKLGIKEEDLDQIIRQFRDEEQRSLKIKSNG